MECGVKLSKHDNRERVNQTLFKSLVGSQRYLICTRPNILFGIGLLSRNIEVPTMTHLITAKRILRHTKGTLDFGLSYLPSKEFKFVGYSDSDWARDTDDRKSDSGFVFYMGDMHLHGHPKSKQLWLYVAITSSVCHVMWLRNLLKELQM